jgi:7-cyano-7-deazaguanine synthase in queuosine biosynthesis
MSREHVLILTSGGLRSLVATALELREPEAKRVTLLLIDDGRPTVEQRRRYAQRQADAFELPSVQELAMPHLYGHGFGRHPDGTPMGALVLPQLLSAALGWARQIQAGRIIWPGSVAGDAAALATATEQLMLVEHLAELEATPAPEIDAPLLELTDPQLIELGAQLPVDWEQAWTCGVAGQQHCRICPGCTRRLRAFELAGLVDPAMPRQRGAA